MCKKITLMLCQYTSTSTTSATSATSERQRFALSARGRVSDSGKRPVLFAYLVTTNADTQDLRVECVDGRGFRALAMVPDTIRGGRKTVSANQVECVLGDGTVLACEGYWESGTLRLDAVDQDAYYWFWLEVVASC